MQQRGKWQIAPGEKLNVAELNRILRDIQNRLDVVEGRAGEVPVLDDVAVDGAVRLKPTRDKDLGTQGLVYFEDGRIWGHETIGEGEEEVPRRVQVIQEIAEDDVPVGKASTLNFESPLAALLDADDDQINVYISSGTASAGYVLSADGSGGVAWSSTADLTQYQLRSEKNTASGYAGLDASSVVVPAVKLVRSGLDAGLPALAPGELYFATDVVHLYIGA
jgi:hypothetical protein